MKYLLGIDCVQVADNESNPEESTGGLCPPQFAAMSHWHQTVSPMIPNVSKPQMMQNKHRQKTFKLL